MDVNKCLSITFFQHFVVVFTICFFFLPNPKDVLKILSIILKVTAVVCCHFRKLFQMPEHKITLRYVYSSAMQICL